MPKTIDPLLLLREHIQSNKKIELQGKYLSFQDGTKLKVDTPTACFNHQTDKQYTLGSLWLFLKHKDDSLTIYRQESTKAGIDTVVGVDKDDIKKFFLENDDNVDVINQDLRSKTLIFLGKKKHGDNFEKIIENEHKTSKQTTTDKNDVKDARPLVKKPRIEEQDPNLRVMDYIYTREKKSLNRNSVLKPIQNPPNFADLLKLCCKIFLQVKGGQRQAETLSFLDELISADDLKGNKAIIIVPSTYYPGNLCLDNAKQFLLDAR